eukprot:351377-Chlamydomonas_euryale.AAC.9
MKHVVRVLASMGCTPTVGGACGRACRRPWATNVWVCMQEGQACMLLQWPMNGPRSQTAVPAKGL